MLVFDLEREQNGTRAITSRRSSARSRTATSRWPAGSRDRRAPITAIQTRPKSISACPAAAPCARRKRRSPSSRAASSCIRRAKYTNTRTGRRARCCSACALVPTCAPAIGPGAARTAGRNRRPTPTITGSIRRGCRRKLPARARSALVQRVVGVFGDRRQQVADDPPSPVLISTVTAMPGVRLTMLAVDLHLRCLERRRALVDQFLAALRLAGQASSTASRLFGLSGGLVALDRVRRDAATLPCSRP